MDYVVIFDGLTAAEILLDLLPDVHCKGTDYSEETVPEREVVKSFGGRCASWATPRIIPRGNFWPRFPAARKEE